ncbi:MAG: RNA polymerase sigma factor [Halioglobus sp.]
MAQTSGRNYEADEARWSSLMIAAQGGCEADYRCLLGELSDVITRYLRSRIGSHHFIEDCVQETLIAIHLARHTYDPGRNFRPWLFAIVRHKAIDALRKQKSLQNTATRHQILEEMRSTSENLDNDILSGRLINSLTTPYREAITLTKLIGLSTAEAAEHLAISESAVKVRVHRAMGSLKNMMEADPL